jgi:hypothetical protein
MIKLRLLNTDILKIKIWNNSDIILYFIQAHILSGALQGHYLGESYLENSM